MTSSTIFLLFLSVLIAASLSFYHYLFRANTQLKSNWILALLRFFSILCLLVLLINPTFTRKTTELSKTPLALLIDNSSSIKELKSNRTALNVLDKILTNKEISEKFAVQKYLFDKDFGLDKPIDFEGKQSNIDLAAQNLKQLYKHNELPIILLSDGNQTIGNDYEYSFQETARVFPIVLGDTTSNFDLKISRLNVNKYAFLKNKFPVEVFLQYNGTKPCTATFSIQKEKNKVFNQTVAFSKTKKTVSLEILVEADKIGLQKYKAILSSTYKEKNTYNNVKNFAVEVLDQQKEIALISDITHPDLGAIKRAIESNEQRKVKIYKPKEISDLKKIDLLILYQPTSAFKAIIDANVKQQINTFIITGVSTDFNFVNQIQNDLQFKMTPQTENFTANYQSGFQLFAQEDIAFSQLPPLTHRFGKIIAKNQVETMIKSSVNGVSFENPILTFSENNTNRSAYLLGENIWKWRLESYLFKKSFEDFDLFMNKIIHYLSTNSSKKNLLVTHEQFYNSGETIAIEAQYFNKNYELNKEANLTIELKNSRTNAIIKYNFSSSNQGNIVEFDGLEHGNYSFTVKENTSGASYSSSFEVLDFDVEKQFTNPDVVKLNALATKTNGQAFYPNQIEQLIKKLLDPSVFLPTEKEIIKKTPLIDWVTLLIILAVSLATEWFYRKYKGLL